MNTISHGTAVILTERYALVDIERRDHGGVLRLRAEAAGTLRQRGVRGFPSRVLAGTGDLLIWLGEKLKKNARQESPATV